MNKGCSDGVLMVVGVPRKKVTLVAAGSLSNAREFGGQHYEGYHTFMALAPAYEMSKELPEVTRALPVLKVLYRNATHIQAKGGRKNEELRPVKPTPLPEGKVAGVNDNDPNHPNAVVYDFPEECKIRTAPVPRLALGIVIAQAVAAICLWGTLIGSMLPLLFKRLGVDPGIASSPFVATFVDVTGIVIYFSIAKVWLL